jgi:hypothetical protein
MRPYGVLALCDHCRPGRPPRELLTVEVPETCEAQTLWSGAAPFVALSAPYTPGVRVLLDVEDA